MHRLGCVIVLSELIFIAMTIAVNFKLKNNYINISESYL